MEIEGSFTADGSNHSISLGNLFVFMGQGPAFSSGTTPNPTAKGIYINVTSYTAASGNTSFTASGNINLLGFAGLTLSGTGISMSWATGATSVSFSGDMTFGLPGVLLTGAMAFSFANGTFTVQLGSAATGTDGHAVQFDLGAQAADGSFPVAVSIASGSLTLSSAGVVADVTAGLTLNVPGLEPLASGHLGGDQHHQRARHRDRSQQRASRSRCPPSPLQVVAGTTATPATLTVMGQTVSGVFAFSQVVGTLSPQAPAGSTAPITVWLSASDVSLTIGSTSGGAGISNGSGLLLITAEGLAGQIGGTLNVFGLSGNPFSGTFAIKLNTTAVAVAEQATLGGAAVSLNLAGRAVRRDRGRQRQPHPQRADGQRQLRVQRRQGRQRRRGPDQRHEPRARRWATGRRASSPCRAAAAPSSSTPPGWPARSAPTSRSRFPGSP